MIATGRSSRRRRRRRKVGPSTFTDSELAQLLVDEHSEVLGDDFVRVAVADGEAEAIGDDGAVDGVAVCGGDGGRGERAEVEEDGDGWGGDEFLEKLDEDCGRHVADFVEEYAEACACIDVWLVEVLKGKGEAGGGRGYLSCW